MQVITSFKSKMRVIAISEKPNEAIPSKENPRYSQKFWDETKEACAEALAYEKARGGRRITSLSEIKKLGKELRARLKNYKNINR